MAFGLAPQAKAQFFDSNGNPLVGGLLETFNAGTTTPVNSFTDSTGASANTNPIVLDARGEADIWLSDALVYKFELRDSLGALIWTVDNITPVGGGSGGTSLDELVKVTADDIASQYLSEKLTAGSGISLTTVDTGGVKTIDISTEVPTPVKIATNETIDLFNTLFFEDSTGSSEFEEGNGGLYEVQVKANSNDALLFSMLVSIGSTTLGGDASITIMHSYGSSTYSPTSVRMVQDGATASTYKIGLQMDVGGAGVDVYVRQLTSFGIEFDSSLTVARSTEVNIPLLSAGLSIGDSVSGSIADRVLYMDSSNVLADSSNLTFDGTILKALEIEASQSGSPNFWLNGGHTSYILGELGTDAGMIINSKPTGHTAASVLSLEPNGGPTSVGQSGLDTNGTFFEAGLTNVLSDVVSGGSAFSGLNAQNVAATQIAGISVSATDSGTAASIDADIATVTGSITVADDITFTSPNSTTAAIGDVLTAVDTAGKMEWAAGFDPVNSAISTGVLTGGVITINAGNPAQIDVSAGTGIIWNWVNPAIPTRTLVTWSAQIGVTITDIGTTIFTSFYFDSAGVLQQNAGVIATPQQRRQTIVLQEVSHTQMTVVESITTSQNLAYEATEAIMDYIRTVGALNTGNAYKANGANLAIDKDSGTTTLPWINSDIDLQNPAIKTNPGQVAIATILRSYPDGSGGYTFDQVSVVDPDVVDDGSGTLATVANNKYTNRFFIFFGATNMTVMVMGNTEYGTLQDCIGGAASEFSALDVNPILVSGRITTILSVKKGTTSLLSGTEAQFTIAVSLIGGGVSTGLTIGDAISGSTADQILYMSTGNVLAQSSNLLFDGTFLTLVAPAELQAGFNSGGVVRMNLGQPTQYFDGTGTQVGSAVGTTGQGFVLQTFDNNDLDIVISGSGVMNVNTDVGVVGALSAASITTTGGAIFTGEVDINEGFLDVNRTSDSRIRVKVGGTTIGQIQATATAFRFAALGSGVSAEIHTNGAARLTINDAGKATFSNFMNLTPLASDPSSLVNGDIWARTDGTFKCRSSGVTKTFTIT